jgi:Putative transposase of IS4/5 family (DUF4096)
MVGFCGRHAPALAPERIARLFSGLAAAGQADPPSVTLPHQRRRGTQAKLDPGSLTPSYGPVSSCPTHQASRTSSLTRPSPTRQARTLPRPWGRPTPDPDRNCVATLIFMARLRIPWRLLPAKELDCGSATACWRRLDEWAKAGAFDRTDIADRMIASGDARLPRLRDSAACSACCLRPGPRRAKPRRQTFTPGRPPAAAPDGQTPPGAAPPTPQSSHPRARPTRPRCR